MLYLILGSIAAIAAVAIIHVAALVYTHFCLKIGPFYGLAGISQYAFTCGRWAGRVFWGRQLSSIEEAWVNHYYWVKKKFNIA